RAGADHSLTFTAPAAALGATELYHLFVAKLNQPIELATDQSPSGVVAGTGAGAPVGATVVLRSITGSGTPIPIGGASRRGNLLLAHRNRLWVSGDLTPAGAPTNASRVYASSIILPGAEQAIFDMQPFFPLNATLNVGRQDGDRVTALARRGFYKLAITPSGGTANTQQWWLDLRRGLGSRPSWWGPHTTTPLVAMANARQDTAEVDRALQLQSKGTIAAIDQTNVFTDLVDDAFGTTATPIVSKLTTSRLDAGAPFDRKR